MHVEGLDRALGVEHGAFGAITERHRARYGRPFVTLCWAQTLDGCTALVRGTPTALSGPESRRLTHALRASHRAILVGIGTVLADDPLLTVRRVPGESPQPVIVDGSLRLPAGSRLLREGRGPWVYTVKPVDADRQAELEQRGVVVRVVARDDAGHVDLAALLDDLGRSGVPSLMVEGGATVITTFLRRDLGDRAAITIAPIFAGGYASVGLLGRATVSELPRLYRSTWTTLGPDALVSGSLRP